jgi:hypothetical protein
MTSCRTIGLPGPLRTLLVASGLAAGWSLAAAAQTASDALLAPTPLILKDGRIANVSVHVVGFPHLLVLGFDRSCRATERFAFLASQSERMSGTSAPQPGASHRMVRAQI